MNDNEVFIGNNSITLSPATMNKIIQDWLHVNVSGGPYKVHSVSGGGNSFDVEFTQEPLKDGANRKEKE